MSAGTSIEVADELRRRRSDMRAGIHIARVWSDEDLVELRMGVCDGRSVSVNEVYVGHPALADAASSLDAFRQRVDGGHFDLRFGAFGPEYASGAFHARFQFEKLGRLLVSCDQESEFVEFGTQRVAGRARMFIRSEPALFDRFVVEFRMVSVGSREAAHLEAVGGFPEVTEE